MAREENKNKYSNIEHVRTNMLWMDIKIVDPEMEALMKQINEEQTRLKEALREKLRLMRYDTDVIQKENELIKECLRSKGVQVEEKKHDSTVKEENEIKTSEELVNVEANKTIYNEEKVKDERNAKSTPSLKEVGQTKKTVSKLAEETENTNTEISRLDGNCKDKNNKCNENNILQKNTKTKNKGIDNSSINNRITKEESGIATRTRRSAQVIAEPVGDILLSEKKPKRDMKRRRLLKKYRAVLKRKRNTKEKINEAESNEDAEREGEP